MKKKIFSIKNQFKDILFIFIFYLFIFIIKRIKINFSNQCVLKKILLRVNNSTVKRIETKNFNNSAFKPCLPTSGDSLDIDQLLRIFPQTPIFILY